MRDIMHFERRLFEKNQLLAMLKQEAKTCTNKDEHAALPETHTIWRRKICEWSYNIVDHFHLDREVVSLSTNYLDRFMLHRQQEIHRLENLSVSKSEPALIPKKIDGRTFQLIATTALYIAIKIHGEYIDTSGTPVSQRLSIKSFVNLSRGQFSAKDLEFTEIKLLNSLEWRVNPPVPIKFVAYLLRLLPTVLHNNQDSGNINNEDSDFEKLIIVDNRVLHVLHEISRYLTEVSVFVFSLSAVQKPSVVAFATILISINLINKSALPFRIREIFFARVRELTSLHTKSKDVIEVISHLNDMCPEITDCCNNNNALDSKDHPIIIAREAGLLASHKLSPKKSNLEKERPTRSPCSITNNHLHKSF